VTNRPAVCIMLLYRSNSFIAIIVQDAIANTQPCL
jgi:hypothetical protein